MADHDKVVGTALARILAGGSLPHQTTVSEQYLLDLEREAFSEAVRRAEDAGADSVHPENRQDIAQLMQVIDRGRGVPIVMIPGIQGRWEYMRPAIEALEGAFRIITFALAGERKSRRGSIGRVVSTTSSIRSTRSSISAA